MNNKLKLLLALLTVSATVGVAAACNKAEPPQTSSSSESSSEVKKESYTVVFVDYDDVVISEETYEEGAEIEVPADPTRADADGYSYVFAGWDKEVSETATGDVTYKATYTQTAIGYKVTFEADGVAVETKTYTVDNKEIVAPAVPEKAGYTGAWESYELTTGDITVKAVYTAIEYTISFTHPKTGMLVAAPITYTVETISEIEFPEIPDELKMEHYTVSWNKTVADVAIGGLDVNPVWTADEYTVTFMADGVQVGDVLKYTVDNTEISAPAVPNKAHYEGAWESYELNGGNKVVNAVYTAKEYTVTFMADGVQVGEVLKYTVENTNITVPQIPAKEGHGAKWESYTLDGGDKVINAIYELGVYTVTFMADGVEVGTDTYTIEDKDITEPAVPAKDHYENGRWESYELTTGDVTVNAVYDAVEYTVTFKADGVQVGEVLTYTVENTTITESAVPAKDHYENGAWESYELNGGNKVVNAVYDAVEYTVTFLDENGETVGTETYTVEDTEIDEPAVPAKLGYTGKWVEYALAGGNVEVSPEYTANTYKITYNANGGTASTTTQDVEFGDTYTLATATAPKAYQDFLGWADESGKIFVVGEAWDIASDVTLTAVYSKGMTFNNGVVPTGLSIADTTAALSIVEMDGNKVLKLENSNNAPAMKATVAFLEQFFNDSSVDYIAFDAKADVDSNNFRRDTNRDGALTAVTYEQDMTYEHDSDGDGTKEKYPTTGIRSDAWKTFYFSRADYEFWVSQDVTEARFIACGGFSAGKNIYLDNIRPVTAAERTAGIGSFESAGIRINDAGKTLLFYTLDQGGTWQFNMMVNSGIFTNVGLTNDNVTDGIAALTFTKEAGNLSINMSSGKTFTDSIVKTTGYWAIDVYVPANSDAAVSYHTTTWAGVTLKKGGWTTIYVKDSKNQLIISDTTGGTYCIDNMRSITEAEYTLGGLSMEANASGLRTKELGDDTAHSGVCYYYGGADHTANTFSFAIGEGNGASDVAALKNVSLSSEQAHDGTYSLAIEKGNGYLYLTMRNDSTAYATLKDGFTFWIYSTVAIDGVNTKNFVNGVNEKFNGGEGIIIPANTWTQVTVTAADMNPTRFLIIQGSTEGTIYLDDFKPLN